MKDFDSACELMKKQLGADATMALATCFENDVAVRIVDGYYKNGYVYILTHTSTLKMKHIEKNPNVSICKDLMQAMGTGENLGNPREQNNSALAPELKEVFSAFYDRHVNEDDPGTCILRIKLDRAAVFDEKSKYVIDYKNQSAERYDFENDIV